MSDRPKILHVGGTLYWVIRTRNPDTEVLKDADSTPTVAVRKNGASVGDSVTVTKRSATTGIYDCSYNPAGEVEGDKFTLEESATVTGTTTSSATYENSWDVTVIAVERGTDGANTTTPPTAGAIADAVLEESILDHRNVAHSLARYIYQIKQATLTIDGVVSNAITPTTLTFSSNISATTSAYAHAVLLFVSGPLTGENSPIISYNNTNGVFVLEEALTAAPSDGDEFVVIAGSHVHAISDIQNGLATSTGMTAAFTEIKGTGWNSATDTLKEIKDASDAATVIVTPLSSTVEQRVNGTTITVFLKENTTVGPIVVTDANGNNVNLSAPCEIIISQKYRGDVIVIADGSITRSGVDNHQFSFSSSGATLIPGTFSWSLRRVSDNYVFAYGDWIVKQTAAKD